MSEEELRAEIALFHPGETAIITFSADAGVPELQALAELAKEGLIVIDATFPRKRKNSRWTTEARRRRRFTAVVSMDTEKFGNSFQTRFFQLFDLGMITRFEEELP